MLKFQIVSKIKKLKEIKPRKEWVVLTKERILSNETPSFPVFSFFLKPVFIFSIITTIVGIGIIFHLQNQNQKISPVLTETTNTVSEKSLILALENLSTEIAKTNLILQTSKNNKEITGAVTSTIKTAKIAVQEAKKFSSLASIAEELEEKTEDLAKNQAKICLENLKNSSLNEIQKQILAESEKCYKEGDFECILEKACQ